MQNINHLILSKFMLKKLLVGAMCFLAFSCKKTDSTTVTPSSNNPIFDISVLQNKFSSNVTVSIEGDYLVIKSNGVPDHKSPYFASTDSRYEAYNGTNTNFSLNPNRISEQSYVFKIPLKPTKASTSAATPLGPIGVSLNGVPFFNQYAANYQPLTNEINTLDQYLGHPQQTGQYHYHIEPTYLTGKYGKSVFLGVLLDGFPVYGPIENGKAVTNADLDNLHGHSHATTEFPNGIYHYHITDTDPYLNGAGFYGTAGTLSR